jgi:tetratricopeptide (TPR) repeat protein
MKASIWAMAAMTAMVCLAQEQSGTDAVVQAYNKLKAAEAAKDAAGIKQWAAETSRVAREAVKNARNDDDGKKQADYARQVDTYTEYSLMAAALSAKDPKDTVALVDQLRLQNPKSQYMTEAIGPYLNALRETGGAEKAGEAATEILKDFPDNEDGLLMAADLSQSRKEPEKMLDYATRLVQVLQTKAAPAGVPEAEWEKQKNTKLGLGYWYQGLGYNSQEKFAEADKALRQAVPLLPARSSVLGVGLFNLGLADYKLAKETKGKPNRAMLEDALKYSQEAAAIQSPSQEQAAENAKAIKGELGAPARRKR